MSTLLKYFNYNVLEAVNGNEALFMTQTERPDLVITDILMPGMDGLELVERIRADPALNSTRIIFYSATYRLSDARRMAAQLGAFHVIGKPAEPGEILETIALALGEEPDGGAARREAVATAGPPAEGLAEQYLQTVDRLEATSTRLTSIIELSLDLIAERDLDRIIELFCGAARELLGARHAAVAITDGRGGPLLRFVTRGYDAATDLALRQAAERGELLPNPPVGQGKIRHPRPGGGATPALGFPAGQPLPATLLAVSLHLAERDLGWFYVAGKQAGTPFDDEDVRIAHTLGALAALTYENAFLFEEASGQAGRLRGEIGQRRWAQRMSSEAGA